MRFTNLLIVFLSIYSFVIEANAQKNDLPEKKTATGKTNSASLGINLTLEEISGTHSLGFGFQFARSKHRFGRLTALPTNPIGFTYNIGAEYLLGKKDSFNVKYKSYTFIHAFGGFILNSGLNGNINLTAGPTASVYRNNTLFGIGFNFNGNYYFSSRWGIAPSLLFFKQQETNNIWIASLKGAFIF